MKHRFEEIGRGLLIHLVESRSQMLCSHIGKNIFLSENAIRLGITKRHSLKNVTADCLPFTFPKQNQDIIKSD